MNEKIGVEFTQNQKVTPLVDVPNITCILQYTTIFQFALLEY